MGGNAMVWHRRPFLLVLALVVFRAVWSGFVCVQWARFVLFLYGPRSMTAYLLGDSGPGGRYSIGHGPVCALSVCALLGLLLIQVATGLMAYDEIAITGPLNRFVSNTIANAVHAWHAEIGKPPLIVLAIVHVVAVLYCLCRRKRNLIPPTIHGDMLLPADAAASDDGPGGRILALVIVAATSALAWWVGSMGAT